MIINREHDTVDHLVTEMRDSMRTSGDTLVTGFKLALKWNLSIQAIEGDRRMPSFDAMLPNAIALLPLASRWGHHLWSFPASMLSNTLNYLTFIKYEPEPIVIILKVEEIIQQYNTSTVFKKIYEKESVFLREKIKAR